MAETGRVKSGHTRPQRGQEGDRGRERKKCQYLKEEPPTNSRMMEVGGISLSLTATK